MIKRGLALTLVLGMASVAQAGVIVTLEPTTAPPFPPDSVVTVEVKLHRDAAVADHLLRLTQLDFSWDAALGLSALTWSVGADHYEETDIAGGRPNLAAAAHHGDTTTPFLGPDPVNQLLLPGDGTPVKVAEFNVTMPSSDGSYAMDAAGANAQVIYGFGCDSGSPCDNGEPDALFAVTMETVTGDPYTFVVGPPDVVEAITWESMALQGAAGEVGLEISATGTSSEPRSCGMGKLLVTFSGAIDPMTALPANVALAGRDVDQVLINPADYAIGTSVITGDTQLEITFTPTLPDFVKYKVTLVGVESAGGSPIAGLTEIIVTKLAGDVIPDRRVRANDVGSARALVGTFIDPANTTEVRSDFICDGRIRANDVGAIRANVGNNATGIMDP